ncbi:chymotrypsinogen B-like isoform X2 [Acropora palmata]|uniref:chymotrypsinogen B-like isoform X2 n=1 Tax=Acropora palmata TaxID=6131 RepID=UPI003D9FD6C2
MGFEHLHPLFVCQCLVFSAGLTFDLFDRDCVTEHNMLRRQHGAQPLIWSEALAEDAQKWAEYLAINDKIQHDTDTLAEKDEGENIAWFVPPQPKCQAGWKPDCVMCREVVQNWYDEAKNYDYQHGTAKHPGLPITHFAQVVWNGSMEIGVGSAISKTFGFIFVARYSPKGAMGAPQIFRKNVFVTDKYAEDTKLIREGSSTDSEITNQRALPDITCGISKEKGPAGDEGVTPGKFPWDIAFKYANQFGKSNVFCRGSLLDRQWILTAAHCFVVLVNPKFKLEAILGEFDGGNEDGQEVATEVAKVIRHPLHRKNTKDYNIALVKLKTPLRQFNDYMRPICLPDTSLNLSGGEICAVAGYGYDNSTGKQGKTLRTMNVAILSPNECRRNVLWLTDSMLCTVYTKRILDTCKGDSGGPLACYIKGKFYLGGIVSHGKKCSRISSPNIYTNVKYLMPWIRHVIRNN